MKESSSSIRMSLKGNLRKNDKKKNNKKEKDDDLLLFRELNKVQYGGTTTATTTAVADSMSLLHPLSDQFDHSLIMNHHHYHHPNPSPNPKLHHKHPTFDFLAENNDKHDYNWLKTPPATPLFLSIEMEATHTQLPLQREIPVLQPLSRFSDGNNTINIGDAYAYSKMTMINLKKSSSVPQKPKHPISTPTPTPTPTPPQKTSTPTFSSSKSKTLFMSSKTTSTKATPTMSIRESRAVSPLVRSTLAMTSCSMMSKQTPPNLRTVADPLRSASAIRDHRNRQARATTPTSTTSNPRMRQSCSPTVSRGRNPHHHHHHHHHDSTTTKAVAAGFMGSTMVDKVMNARRASANANPNRPTTTKPIINSPTTTQTSASAFGRMKKTTTTTTTRDKTTIK